MAILRQNHVPKSLCWNARIHRQSAKSEIRNDQIPANPRISGMTTKLTKLIPFIMLGLTAIFFVGCAAETTTSTTTTQTDRTRSSMYAR